VRFPLAVPKNLRARGDFLIRICYTLLAMWPFRRKTPLVNRFIRYLIISDTVLFSATGLVAPIFAVFITDRIEGGDLTVVGLAATVFLATKSILQLPISWLLDRKKGERDDFLLMVAGSFLFTAVPLIYMVSTSPWHIYLAQFVFGMASAMNVPGWLALFTRHIDKEREAFSWALHSTSFQGGMAATAAIGAFVAKTFGFQTLFLLHAFFLALGSFILLFVYRDILDGDKKLGGRA